MLRMKFWDNLFYFHWIVFVDNEANNTCYALKNYILVLMWDFKSLITDLAFPT